MAPKKTTKAKTTHGAALDYEAQLRAAADNLHGYMDIYPTLF